MLASSGTHVLTPTYAAALLTLSSFADASPPLSHRLLHLTLYWLPSRVTLRILIALQHSEHTVSTPASTQYEKGAGRIHKQAVTTRATTRNSSREM